MFSKIIVVQFNNLKCIGHPQTDIIAQLKEHIFIYGKIQFIQPKQHN